MSNPIITSLDNASYHIGKLFLGNAYDPEYGEYNPEGTVTMGLDPENLYYEQNYTPDPLHTSHAMVKGQKLRMIFFTSEEGFYAPEEMYTFFTIRGGKNAQITKFLVCNDFPIDYRSGWGTWEEAEPNTVHHFQNNENADPVNFPRRVACWIEAECEEGEMVCAAPRFVVAPHLINAS